MNDSKYKYTYLDLRFHPYMFEAADFRGENSRLEFFRYVLNGESHAIEDYSEKEVYEALRRQYEEFAGTWSETCERAFERIAANLI